MLFLIVKYAVTALVIVVVSEVAKRSDRAGALIASLPLVTMIWLHVEKQSATKIANHAYYTFWYVLPTMPMFLLMPWMIRKGFGFLPALGTGCLLTILSFAAAALILKRFGIALLP